MIQIWESVCTLVCYWIIVGQEFLSAFTEESVHRLCIDYVIYHSCFCKYLKTVIFLNGVLPLHFFFFFWSENFGKYQRSRGIVCQYYIFLHVSFPSLLILLFPWDIARPTALSCVCSTWRRGPPTTAATQQLLVCPAVVFTVTRAECTDTGNHEQTLHIKSSVSLHLLPSHSSPKNEIMKFLSQTLMQVLCHSGNLEREELDF